MVEIKDSNIVALGSLLMVWLWLISVVVYKRGTQM